MTNALELEIDVASRTPDRPQVFVVYVPPSFPYSRSPALAEQWRQAWMDAGASTPPVLLVLPDDFDLKGLLDEDLRRAGLMRLPE